MIITKSKINYGSKKCMFVRANLQIRKAWTSKVIPRFHIYRSDLTRISIVCNLWIADLGRRLIDAVFIRG